MKRFIFCLLVIGHILHGQDLKNDIALMDLLNASKNVIGDCCATMEDDTLRIGNKFLERTFKWNNGNLISLRLSDKLRKSEIEFVDGLPDFHIKDLTDTLIRSTYRSRIVEQTPLSYKHLEFELINRYRFLEIKKVFRIYSNSIAIPYTIYIKVLKDNIGMLPEEAVIERVSLAHPHWELRGTQFFDATDERNNLTKTHSLLPFVNTGNPSDTGIRANLISITSLVGDKGFFILKEAPCSFVQNNYPGYDFQAELITNSGRVNVKSVSLGIGGNDLLKDEWVKCYGYVSGIYGKSETGRLLALRSYQKNIRRNIPARDEMIMGCTWGDRNRDKKISEKFIEEELLKAKKMGITHYVIDDGWQQVLSMNSSSRSGRLWDKWTLKDWQPHKERFPNGFPSIISLADSLEIEMGLWFHPSNENDYGNWEQDADILISLHKQFGFKYFKIDGVKLPSKKAEINLLRFVEKVLVETGYAIVFSFDATADNRFGCHYNN